MLSRTSSEGGGGRGEGLVEMTGAVSYTECIHAGLLVAVIFPTSTDSDSTRDASAAAAASMSSF